MKYITDLKSDELETLLGRFGIQIEHLSEDAAIPGSFWGAPEAGIIKNTLYVRPDTPVHSALHESCHYICMDDTRRQTLHTDTGGDYDEENAVCYLQIILSAHLSGIGSKTACDDMDEWGYTFRLGSAKAWLETDADDALRWLLSRRLLAENQSPTWKTHF